MKPVNITQEMADFILKQNETTPEGEILHSIFSDNPSGSDSVSYKQKIGVAIIGITQNLDFDKLHKFKGSEKFDTDYRDAFISQLKIYENNPKSRPSLLVKMPRDVEIDLVEWCEYAGYDESKTRNYLTERGYNVPSPKKEDIDPNEGANYLKIIRKEKGDSGGGFKPPRPRGDDFFSR